ncbi:MAG: phosphotransferase family protein [Rhodoblastus sp.]|nr:phosphotransferase family protein [Rhodoblastus sp.]
MGRLEEALASYLTRHFGHAVRVESLDRIPVGASRETYRFVMRADREAELTARRMILRLDPPTSLIETDRRTEYAAIRAFHGSDVPVPELLLIEEDPEALGASFIVMQEIVGGEAAPYRLIEPPYRANLETTGQHKWSILGSIAKTDPAACGLDRVLPPVAAEDCWRQELQRWETMLDADELEPQPIQRAAIRWMKRNPPPPAQRISVVHGDYRTGNLLVSDTGAVIGVLDWEMAHLGDPLEDLAWSINRVWCFRKDERRGGMLPKDEAIAIWEKSSGLAVDADALRWWELLACLKGQAIWISATKEYQTGATHDPLMALAGWMQVNSQDRATLELMGRLSHGIST